MTSYMDFSLYMDFYIVIFIFGPPEAATIGFLFHVTVLSACSCWKGEMGGVGGVNWKRGLSSPFHADEKLSSVRLC